MKQFMDDAKWDELKKAAEGKERLYKHDAPRYDYGRMCRVVKRDDGQEHIFDRRCELEADEFYEEQMKRYNEIHGDGRRA